MKKLLSALVLGAVLLAACGGGSSAVAATVDGTDVTVGDIEALIDSGGATVAVEQFAQYLAFAIQWNIMFAAAEADYGVEVSEEDASAEAGRLVDQLAAEGESREDFLSSRGVTEEFLINIAEQSLIDARIREMLVNEAPVPTDEEIEQARVDGADTLTEVCASHILVETEDEANAVLDRLEDGEEFADLATELSIDTGSGANGGDLGCTSPAQYVDEFKAAVLEAPIGEVVAEPVESQFGFHIILVAERTEPTEDELMASVIETSVNSEIQTWFFDSMETAEVTVAEEYGTWTPVPPSITPPGGADNSPTTTILDSATTTVSE
jgi:foldase protein PrsA